MSFKMMTHEARVCAPQSSFGSLDDTFCGFRAPYLGVAQHISSGLRSCNSDDTNLSLGADDLDDMSPSVERCDETPPPLQYPNGAWYEHGYWSVPSFLGGYPVCRHFYDGRLRTFVESDPKVAQRPTDAHARIYPEPPSPECSRNYRRIDADPRHSVNVQPS